MSSPNKLTLNTNPLQYKRARSRGVNKISGISKVSKIKKISSTSNNKNTENMAYTPFKMKGPSLYKSPAKKHNSPAKNSGSAYAASLDLGKDNKYNYAKAHNDNFAPGHTEHTGGQNEAQPGSKNYKKKTKDTKDTKTSPAKKYDSPAKDTRYFGENDMGKDGNMNAVVTHNEKHEKNPKWDHSKKKERKKKMAQVHPSTPDELKNVHSSDNKGGPKKPAPTKQTISMNQPQGKKGTKENVAAHKKNEAETISKAIADKSMTADQVNAQLATTRHLKAEKEVKVKSDPKKKYPKNEKKTKVKRNKSRKIRIKLPKNRSSGTNLVTGRKQPKGQMGN